MYGGILVVSRRRNKQIIAPCPIVNNLQYPPSILHSRYDVVPTEVNGVQVSVAHMRERVSRHIKRCTNKHEMEMKNNAWGYRGKWEMCVGGHCRTDRRHRQKPPAVADSPIPRLKGYRARGYFWTRMLLLTCRKQ